jgi:hypothetical protein
MKATKRPTCGTVTAYKACGFAESCHAEATIKELLEALEALLEDAEMYFPTVCGENITRAAEAISKAKTVMPSGKKTTASQR